jgi:hypothetical protein
VEAGRWRGGWHPVGHRRSPQRAAVTRNSSDGRGFARFSDTGEPAKARLRLASQSDTAQ